MKSVLIEGPDSYRVAETRVEEVLEGHLLLAPLLVGICGTDLELVDGSMIYLRNGMAQYPVTPGHEWVASVVEVGAGVTGFAVGDRVVGEVSIGCGDCEACASGNYHRCPSRHETGFMGMPGALRERMVFPATSAHRVPETVKSADAALVEPLAVSYRAVQRADVRAGEEVLVVGAGTIGLLVAMVLRSVHSCDVYVLSDRASRAEFAAGLGFPAHTEGKKYSTVIEAAGGKTAVADSLAALAPGGRLVVTGLTGLETVPIPVDSVVVQDQEIRGSLGSPGVWSEVVGLLAAGLFRPSDLVTHVFDITDFPQAIQLARAREDATGKILIQLHGGSRHE